MKIISKYKDYYDYYQGIFGIDNTKVYNRKDVYRRVEYNHDTTAAETDENVYEFYICGKLYTILEFKGKFYHTAEELEKLDDKLRNIKYDQWGRKLYANGIQLKNWMDRDNKNRFETQYNQTNGIEDDTNIKLREPVLVNRRARLNSSNRNLMTPLLSDFNFHKIMDAKTLYIEVETFLGWLVDNPPLPDKQTNVGKITGHGFDKKTSFRPKMKS